MEVAEHGLVVFHNYVQHHEVSEIYFVGYNFYVTACDWSWSSQYLAPIKFSAMQYIMRAIWGNILNLVDLNLAISIEPPTAKFEYPQISDHNYYAL